jgi:putrescine transport system substrate-binding protein
MPSQMSAPDAVDGSSSYANGNLASQKLINDEIKSDKSIYPDVDLTNRLYVTTPYDPQTQRIVTRAWTKFVTGE